jgi:hypothetical protein
MIKRDIPLFAAMRQYFPAAAKIRLKAAIICHNMLEQYEKTHINIFNSWNASGIG